MAESTGNRLERILLLVLAAGFVLATLLACTSAFRMSLSADEAWILYAVQGLVERGEYAHPHGVGPTTTGGLHTVAESLLFVLAGNSVPVLRLFPLLCLGLLVREIFAWSRRAGLSRPAALLSGSALIAVPGTLTLAGSAFGAVPAAFLTIAGIRLWDPIAGGRRWLAAAIFGLATATRVQCAVVFPALLAGSMTGARTRREDLVPVAVAVVMGLAVFAAWYAALASTTVAGEATALAYHSAGFDADATLSDLTRKWVSANRFMALPILVCATLVAEWLGRVGFDEPHRLRILVWFGWLSVATWIAIAPIPHLRYLWPGLAAFACVLGFGLGQLYERGRCEGRSAIRVGALLLGIACLAAGCGTTLRHVALGDLNMVTWEWRGIIAVASDASRRIGGQREMADYLRRLPRDERVGVLDHPLELEFLSGRPLVPLRWLEDPTGAAGEPLPSRILMTPHIGNRVQLHPELQQWLRSRCRLEVRFGAHALCRVVGEYPPNVAIITLRRGSTRRGR